jgi:ATP-dependent RNA helicase HelY
MRSDRDGPRPLVVTAQRQARRLSVVDFPTPVAARGQLRLPRKLNPRNPQSRRDLASALRQKARSMPPARRLEATPPAADGDGDDIEQLRRQLRTHPCHSCPDREDHARWAERYLKLERDAADLRRRIEQRTGSIARQFDRVCEVLDELAYLDGETVTADGRRLARLYNELDLVAAECLRRDVWVGLSPPELAACLSGLVYEARNPDEAPPPRLPRGPIRGTAEVMSGIWSELERLERSHRVRFLREPDFGFAWAAYRWARGASLDHVLVEADFAAGDFVRAVKQLLDVIDQVADAAGPGDLRTTAREASDALRRGVVAYSSVATD